MTAPKHARDLPGKGRYYGACGGDGCPFGDRLLISVTNAQSVINKPALPPSAAKTTAAAAWNLLPQMIATSRQPAAGRPADKGKPCERRSPVSTRCGRCRFCVNAAIKAAYRQEWEEKAELGTRIHQAAHAHVLGEPRVYDEEVEPFLGQYLRFLDDWGVDLDTDVEAAETTIVDWDREYAGTGDVWLWLRMLSGRRRVRRLTLVDIKTSRDKPANVIYPDQEIQLAGLRYAPKALLPDDTEIDVPPFDGAAILNLRADAYALIPVPTGRDAYRAFLGAVTLQRHFHSQDIRAWTPIEAPATPAPTSRKAS